MAYFYGYVLIGVVFCFIPKISNDLHKMQLELYGTYKNAPIKHKIFAELIMFTIVTIVIFLWPLEVPSLLRGKK